MLSFDALQDFLTVRPALAVGQVADDKILTPFVSPGTSEPISVNVRALGNCFLVHDDGRAVAQVHDLSDVKASPAFEPFRDNWIAAGLNLDEEGRVFALVSDKDQFNECVARVIQGQIMLVTLGRACKHTGGCAAK